MQITSSRQGNVTILDVIGSMNLDDHQDFKQALNRLLYSGPRNVVLNLRECSYIEPDAVNAMITSRADLRACGGDLRLLHPAPRVEQTLAMVRRRRNTLKLFHDRDAAIASYSTKTN